MFGACIRYEAIGNSQRLHHLSVIGFCATKCRGSGFHVMKCGPRRGARDTRKCYCNGELITRGSLLSNDIHTGES
jgi:hypothetical protein